MPGCLMLGLWYTVIVIATDAQIFVGRLREVNIQKMTPHNNGKLFILIPGINKENENFLFIKDFLLLAHL